MNTTFDRWVVDQGEKAWDNQSFKQQIRFLRELRMLLSMGLGRQEVVCSVVGEHTSKSVKLPVVMFDRSDLNLQLVLRNNFYDWKLSVISMRPITADFSDLFCCNPPSKEDLGYLHPVYFEGFPKEYIFSYYSLLTGTWSASIDSDYDLYMVVRLILRALGVSKPLG